MCDAGGKAYLNRQDWIRLAIHLPWGLLPAGITFFHPLGGSLILVSTFVYEAFNDWRKEDHSYKDVLGIVWGYIIGITLGVIIRGG